MDYTMILGAAAGVAAPCVISWLAGDLTGSARTRRHYEAAAETKNASTVDNVRALPQEDGAVAEATIQGRSLAESRLESLIHEALLRQQRRAAFTRAPIMDASADPVGAVLVVDDALARIEDHRLVVVSEPRE